MIIDNFPRLTYRTESYVIAYDLKKRMTLKGGLGALGVGEMWFPMTDEEHKAAIEIASREIDNVRKMLKL